MVRKKRSDEPTLEDWKHAASAVKMIVDFDKADFRETIAGLARVLEGEGLAAHRSADRLEHLSEFTDPVMMSDHTREAILTTVADCYTEQPWHVATTYLARLRDDGLDGASELRQQAAILLDAAETIGRLLRWYAARTTALNANDLMTDTVVAIMLEWKVGARETSRQLAAYDIAVTEGALKMAAGRERGIAKAGNEPPLLFFLPLLRRRVE